VNGVETEITKKLDALGLPYKVKSHRAPVFTSEDAARERGVRISQIVKTMLLIAPSGDVILAVLPGDSRLNVKAIKKYTGHKNLRFMDKAGMEKMGLVVGAIAAVDDRFSRLAKFVDPRVFEEELVDISSGHPEAGIEIESRFLKDLLDHSVVMPISK
jgi:prolyl-tRNA editing enzyme YbaK/EbsC (Cys-tRNA(Pro) deacylase)